jgi:hypothetical protein
MAGKWKVTYSSTRKSNTFATRREAAAQARWAVTMGNMKACVHRKVGRTWKQVGCAKRR